MNEHYLTLPWTADLGLSSEIEVQSLWMLGPQDTAIGSEDDCLQLIDAKFPSRTVHVPLGRGDDCAMLAGLAENPVALSTDFCWQDIHFRTRYVTPREIGIKALAIAVSDLAAAGVQPLGFSLGLFFPATLPKESLEQIIAGLSIVAEYSGLVLSGGDLTCGPSLGFCSTVWGQSAVSGMHNALTRQTARPGDVLFVSGPLGLARVGLLALEKQGRSTVVDYPAACNVFLTPVPHIPVGMALAAFARQHGQEHVRLGVMDVSDGLARDLPRLLGKYGAELFLPDTLLHPEVKAFGTAAQIDPVELAVLGGEDFVLLGSCAENFWDELKVAVPSLERLGRVIDGAEIVVNGARFRQSGFDHFAQSEVATTQRQSSTDFVLEVVGGSEESHGFSLESLEKTLIAVCRDACFKGLLAGFNGNASLRFMHEDVASCLITRAGSMKQRLTASDLACIRLQGHEIIWGEPSSESAMHTALYAACPQSSAVLHTHPPMLAALSVLLPPEERLHLPLFESEAYRNRLGFVPPYPPGSSALAEAVARAASEFPAVWLEEHGLVVHGANIWEALALTEELEQLARIHLEILRHKPYGKPEK